MVVMRPGATDTADTREVHNKAASLDAPHSDKPGNNVTLADVLPDANTREREQVAMRLALQDAIIDAVMTVGLSDLEASILLYRLQDCSYQQIADKLGRRAKATDNGLQRINSKLTKRFRGTGFREDFLTA